MKISVICLVVALAAFTAFPETLGAPAISVAKEQQKSRSLKQSESEEAQSKESFHAASNGLVSGGKEFSTSKTASSEEEEAFSDTEVIKTDKGLAKVEKKSTKKTLVSKRQDKKAITYFIVSYKSLPKQRKHECRIEYYKRIFPKEAALKEFYYKIFKQYSNEGNKAYIERVEFIWDNVYPELDPRLDEKWLEEFDHYYTLKYSRLPGECDEEYYPRVLAKWAGETNEHYKLRMRSMILAIEEEDYRHICFDDSDLGYIIGIKDPNFTSTSEGYTKPLASTSTTSSTVKSAVSNEDVDESESVVVGGSAAKSATEFSKKSTTIESEIHSESQTFKMAYDRLPVIEDGVSLYDYYIKYFGECEDDFTDDDLNELYLRMLIQYRGETVQDYIKRVDYLFDKVYPALDIRTSIDYGSLLSHYYRVKYARIESETEEQWLSRILKKESCDTAEVYLNRVKMLKAAFVDADWLLVEIDEDSDDGYTLVTRGSTTKSLTEDTFMKTYAKLETEDIEQYFTRLQSLLSALTVEEYTETLCAIRTHYPDLAIWYDTKYIDLVKKYYTFTYDKKSTESLEDYYVRLVTKEQFETEEQFIKRIELLHELFPTLELWRDEVYYTKYVKNFYDVIYQQLSTEDKVEYFTRILKKYDGESDEEYVTRLYLIQKTYPELALWYDSEYVDLVKYYYNLAYVKRCDETVEEYYQRLVTKQIYETDEQFIKRVEILHELFPTWTLWKDEEYYSTYVKQFYQIIYKQLETEDISEYFTRVTRKYEGECDEDYVERLTLIQRTYRCLPLWYSEKYFDLVSRYYSLKYAQKVGECDATYAARVFAKEKGDSTTSIYARRIHLIHLLTAKSAIWYDEAYYTQYLKAYYEEYYKKEENIICCEWLKQVLTKLPGECDEIAIKRITLIKKATDTCCWTEENLSKIESLFTVEYFQKIKSTFFVVEVYSSSSSSSSSSAVSSNEQEEDFVEVSRG